MQTSFLTGIKNLNVYFKEIIKSGLKNIDLREKITFLGIAFEKIVIIKTYDKTLSLNYALFLISLCYLLYYSNTFLPSAE